MGRGKGRGKSEEVGSRKEGGERGRRRGIGGERGEAKEWRSKRRKGERK